LPKSVGCKTLWH